MVFALGAKGGSSRSRSLTPLVPDFHFALLTEGVITVAAPSSQFRRRHQPSLDRVAMNIAQLLHVLTFREDIEAIIARLPEGWRERIIPESQLLRVLPLPSARPQGDALLEHLHRPREFLYARLTDEQVKVLWH